MEDNVVDFKSETVTEDLVRALKLKGFAIIRNHGIPAELVEEVRKGWVPYFTNDERHLDLTASEGNEGYMAKGYHQGLDKSDSGNEYFHIFPDAQLLERHSPVPTMKLATMLNSLGLSVLEKLDNIDVKFYSSLREMATGSEKTLFRIIHYWQIEKFPTNTLRCGEHTDNNLITILPATGQPGLQVLANDGEWHAVNPNPGEIVLIVGDMLEGASDGYFKAPPHKVDPPTTNESNVARYCIGLFIYPKPGFKVTKDFTTEELLEEYLRKATIYLDNQETE